MKSFFVGIVVAIVLALVAGFALDAVEIGSETFNSTDNVRL